MKKCLLISIFCLTFLLVGCSSEGVNNSNNINSSVGNNPNSNVNSQTGSNVNAELEKNITCSGAVTERGKLVVFATNANNVAVDMEIEVEFYDENGMILGSDSDSIMAVGKNAEIAIEMWSTPDSFDNYKIYIDAEKTDEISYHDYLEINHNINDKKVAVQIKNNSQDTIDYITVSVVYYKGEQVVGIDDSIDSEIKSGRSANFNLSFPYNKKYKNVDFDTYKVFVNEAYSYNW